MSHTKILVTGSAGFIGFHLARHLARRGDAEVVGLDNLNGHYDTRLKYARLEEAGIARDGIRPGLRTASTACPAYSFYQMDISDYPALAGLFEAHAFDYVIHLAAQAGVRDSISQPQTYIRSNIVGFANMLECCRHGKVKHFIYASSSSIYGMNDKIPFSEDDRTDYPVSLYAATKKSDELLAHAYSHLFRLPATGVRLFTVYGPWGRPDMAPMLFAEAIREGRPIRVFNQGDMLRDFTFIDDIVGALTGLLPQIPGAGAQRPYFQVFNVGNARPVRLMDFIALLERSIGKPAQLEMLPMQPGDVPVTYADVTRLKDCIHYAPSVAVEEGIPLFVDWLKRFHGRP